MEKQVVIITGASAGIGKATAELLQKQDYIVYNFARRKAEGMQNIITDITDEDNVRASFKEVYDKEGKIDALINCAGMGISGSLECSPSALTRTILDVNVLGTIYCCQAVIPYMRDCGGGRIINLSSVAGKLTIPFQTLYSASKSAICSITEGMRMELKPFGIKVSAILPGDVATDFTASRQKTVAEHSAYGDRIHNSVAKMEHDELNGMSPIVIAKLIARTLAKSHPACNIVGGASYSFLCKLAKFLPERLILYILSKMYA